MDLKILHNIYYKSQKTINKQSEKNMTVATSICSHTLPNTITVMFKPDILNLWHENPLSQKGSSILNRIFYACYFEWQQKETENL